MAPQPAEYLAMARPKSGRKKRTAHWLLQHPSSNGSMVPALHSRINEEVCVPNRSCHHLLFSSFSMNNSHRKTFPAQGPRNIVRAAVTLQVQAKVIVSGCQTVCGPPVFLHFQTYLSFCKVGKILFFTRIPLL
jgi:hypothetical protein